MVDGIEPSEGTFCTESQRLFHVFRDSTHQGLGILTNRLVGKLIRNKLLLELATDSNKK